MRAQGDDNPAIAARSDEHEQRPPEQDRVEVQLAQLQAAVDLTSDAVAIVHRDSRKFVSVNSAFERLHGLRASDVIGKCVESLDLWLDIKQRQVMLDLVRAHGRVRDFPARVSDREGGVRDVRVNATIVNVGDQSYVIAAIRDVTEVRRTRRVLRDIQSRMMYLFENSPIPMSLVFSDSINEPLYNQAWFRAFGFDEVLHQGKSGVELGIWSDEADRIKALEMARSQGETGEVEVSMRHADGSERWIALRVRLHEESDRTIFLFSYVDVTQRRVVQDQLQAANERLETAVAEATRELTMRNEALNATLSDLRRAQVKLVETEKVAALGTLVAGLSHEINTPIGNSLLMSTAMETRIERFSKTQHAQLHEDPALAEFLDHTGRAANTLTNNVTKVAQLVAAFKQVASNSPIEKRCTFTVKTLLDGVLLATQELANRALCPVTCDASDVPDVELDSFPAPMMQAIACIVENGIKHGYQGGRLQGPVIVTAMRSEQNLVVEVKDFGVGIPGESIGRVFDPFYTTQLGKSGHGLGLSIAHKAVTKLLGGSIMVYSDGPLRGARFVVTLPLAAPVEIGN